MKRIKYVIAAKGNKGFILINKPCSMNLERITARARLLREKKHIKEVQINTEKGDRVLTI